MVVGNERQNWLECRMSLRCFLVPVRQQKDRKWTVWQKKWLICTTPDQWRLIDDVDTFLSRKTQKEVSIKSRRIWKKDYTRTTSGQNLVDHCFTIIVIPKDIVITLCSLLDCLTESLYSLPSKHVYHVVRSMRPDHRNLCYRLSLYYSYIHQRASLNHYSVFSVTHEALSISLLIVQL
jgi:hypothetical protein